MGKVNFTQEFKSQIQTLFQETLSQSHITSSQFRREIDKFIKDALPSKNASPEQKEAVASHFCRGRKWVLIPTNHELFERARDIATEENLTEVVELWTEHDQAWVRFHSASDPMVRFTIHENSSVASSIKLNVSSEIALGLEQLDGTPKSNGFETKAVVANDNETDDSEPIAEVDAVEGIDEEQLEAEAQMFEDLEDVSFDI